MPAVQKKRPDESSGHSFVRVEFYQTRNAFVKSTSKLRYIKYLSGGEEYPRSVENAKNRFPIWNGLVLPFKTSSAQRIK